MVFAALVSQQVKQEQQKLDAPCVSIMQMNIEPQEGTGVNSFWNESCNNP